MKKDDSKPALDLKNLPALPKPTTYNLPKPPPVDYTRKSDKPVFDMKDMKEFSLSTSQYDLETYWGRFRHQFSRINPKLFFVSNATIEDCKDKVEKFKLREEASKNINAKVYLKE